MGGRAELCVGWDGAPGEDCWPPHLFHLSVPGLYPLY